MARRPSSVCPSVRLSVNFCANRFFSQANGRIATKLSQGGLQVSVHPGCAQGQGHVIRELSWILGMSYSVIDGLVTAFHGPRNDFMVGVAKGQLLPKIYITQTSPARLAQLLQRSLAFCFSLLPIARQVPRETTPGQRIVQ